MNIRDATESDLPAIVGIYNAAIPGRAATADTEEVSVEGRAHWFREHSPERRPLLIAEFDGEVIGWLSLESFYGRPGYYPTAEVSVYVAPEHQRKGVGKRLLKEAIRRGTDAGLKSMLAFIFAHNVPSVRLFETHGFRHWGHLPGVAELDGVERDLLILGRRLSFD